MFFGRSSQGDQRKSYVRLDEEVPDAGEYSTDRHSNNRKGLTSLRNTALVCSILTNIGLSLFSLSSHSRFNHHWDSDPDSRLYSPAQHALSTKVVKAHNGFHEDITEFQGPPSPKLDEAWESLYSFGVSKIPKYEAALLPNKTAAIPGDETNYIIELDVFHELHCLNMIRQALRPDYYKPMMIGDDGEDELFGHTHIGHCVDSIRQSLICSSGISPLVWQWKEEAQRTRIRADIVHTCRDFGAISEWARQHRLRQDFMVEAHIEDNIVIAEF